MPGSRFYWYRWTEGGKRFAVSLKTDDLPEAIRKVKEIQDGRFLVRWARQEANFSTPLTKLVEDYLKKAKARGKKPMRRRTAEQKEAVLLKFLKDTGIENTLQINLGAIEGWLAKLKREGRSADTLHTYARDLNTFLSFLVKHRQLRSDFLNDFEIPERGAMGRKNWLKHDEVDRVIAAASEDPDLTFVLYCGFHAGLRRNEISNAKVGWFDGKYIHVQNDPKSGFILKDRENRSIPISEPFKEFLNKFLDGKAPGEYVLHPTKLQSKHDYRYDFRRTWETHMKRCGVTCTIHDARRSFASNLVSAGESIFIVAKWLGDGVQVVERSYGHLAPSAGNINRLTAKFA